ncbi:hypothetical protein [Bacteriovorax sp. Seq25_V]|uniref:hypothetical protein n=1 Tax=Bacteriovorax sp. Seq25_V TaxID=1201288 RepID=UPI000557ED16|nr:hypothetical protein [Bacteriovorax sp. Seq25_V]
MKLLKFLTCKEVYDHNHGSSKTKRSKLLVSMHMFICKNCQHFEEALMKVEVKMKDSIKYGQRKLNPEKVEQLKQSIKKKL